jgi:hypothetical protein
MSTGSREECRVGWLRSAPPERLRGGGRRRYGGEAAKDKREEETRIS